MNEFSVPSFDTMAKATLELIASSPTASALGYEMRRTVDNEACWIACPSMPLMTQTGH